MNLHVNFFFLLNHHKAYFITLFILLNDHLSRLYNFMESILGHLYHPILYSVSQVPLHSSRCPPAVFSVSAPIWSRQFVPCHSVLFFRCSFLKFRFSFRFGCRQVPPECRTFDPFLLQVGTTCLFLILSCSQLGTLMLTTFLVGFSLFWVSYDLCGYITQPVSNAVVIGPKQRTPLDDLFLFVVLAWLLSPSWTRTSNLTNMTPEC